MSEIVFSGATPAERQAISRAVRAGKLRTLARGVHTDAPTRDALEDVVARNWLQIVGHEMPGAVVTDRSARALRPVDGVLWVAHTRARDLVLPGLVVRPRPGPGPSSGDTDTRTGVWFASRGRGLLDNMVASRARNGPARTLTAAELEDWVGHIGATSGDDELRRLRSAADSLAEEWGMQAHASALGGMIGAAVRTASSDGRSESLRSYAAGVAIDSARDRLFAEAAEALASMPPITRQVSDQLARRQATLPFWDAYFSNFIEGTEFEVDEAAGIVYAGEEADRPADAHDVAATYRLLADIDAMRDRPRSADEFIDSLRHRHGILMAARPEMSPGEFKQKRNRVGSHHFVEPELVEGTLRVGFRHIDSLRSPFHRAALTMFVVSEVHPFLDGNGRTARIAMNSELVAAGEQRIIIPITYRDNYLAGMRAASNGNIDGYIATVEFAQRYTGQLDLSTLETGYLEFIRTDALVPPAEADAANIRVRLPSDPARTSFLDPDARILAGLRELDEEPTPFDY